MILINGRCAGGRWPGSGIEIPHTYKYTKVTDAGIAPPRPRSDSFRICERMIVKLRRKCRDSGPVTVRLLLPRHLFAAYFEEILSKC
ncbi:hypothetical protein MPL1032_30122 [Mesorhizobium plurifarium]|uniref:Uncharacterized protein n=1 Tax=Mesorhizobium plurifarium TaxID=69974 RepID=A0A0K2W2S3_MESPL|nr:hypothetical protein MPL1032_30122 [Mesorhizobium plurifarium]